MKGEHFRNTFAAKGSALYEALENSEDAKAMKIYKDTTQRFDALYPNAKEDRHWFENWREYANPSSATTGHAVQVGST